MAAVVPPRRPISLLPCYRPVSVKVLIQQGLTGTHGRRRRACGLAWLVLTRRRRRRTRTRTRSSTSSTPKLHHWSATGLESLDQGLTVVVIRTCVEHYWGRHVDLLCSCRGFGGRSLYGESLSLRCWVVGWPEAVPLFPEVGGQVKYPAVGPSDGAPGASSGRGRHSRRGVVGDRAKKAKVKHYGEEGALGGGKIPSPMFGRR